MCRRVFIADVCDYWRLSSIFFPSNLKTSRVFQFLLALLGASTGQKGPLWWAAHHRHHHKHSDTIEDIHSPALRGIWWAHVGWVLCDKYLTYDKNAVKDFARFWELRVLDKFHWIAPAALAVIAYFSGHLLDVHAPQVNITGLQMLCVGFCLSTVLVYHATFSINSLAHLIGRRRFQTTDDSKNSLALALVTLGEGWHNNHHRYPGSERQGFYWWEVDVTHYTLKVLSWFRVVWDLRKPPRKILEETIILNALPKIEP